MQLDTFQRIVHYGIGESCEKSEVELVLEKLLPQISVLSPKKGKKGCGGSINVGPSLAGQILVEGQPVTALLDSGSPVTILSLNSMWAQLKKEDQSKEQWKEKVRN